jgi:hypothetical protein
MYTNFFKKNGYLISEKILSSEEVTSLRKNLDFEFKINPKHALLISEFKNEKLIKKILNLYKDKILINIKKQLEKSYNVDLTVLPNFAVQKNYHVNLKQFHGWHRDCGGEMRYEYCNKILAKKNYLFSKIGFYLQENCEYGGSIDIIKSSHKNFSNFKIFLRKLKNIPLKLVIFFHKYFNRFYNLLPESIFMKFLNAKRLYPEIGSAVIFDSKIIHRGSPISKNKLNEISYKGGLYEAETPENVTKYSIYCHFGTAEGIDSYLFDRLKRKDSFSTNELETWVQQVKFIEKYDPELAAQINKIFNPVKEKYLNL